MFLFISSGVDLNGGGKEEDTEWTVIIYNLAVAKFQQRHILQVVINAFMLLFVSWLIRTRDICESANF